MQIIEVKLTHPAAAFAAMTALEIAEAPGDSRERIEPLVAFAAART